MSTTLSTRDFQIASLAAQGMQQREIARRLGCHFNTVYRTLKQAKVQSFMEEIQQQAQRQAVTTLAAHLAQAAAQAVDHLETLLDHGSPRTAFRAAKLILDHGPLTSRGTLGAAPRQGMPLPREDSQLDPYQPIRQALDQAQQGQRQAEALPLTQEPAPEPPTPGSAMPREQGLAPAFYEAQEERWQARLEELKRWPVS